MDEMGRFPFMFAPEAEGATVGMSTGRGTPWEFGGERSETAMERI